MFSKIYLGLLAIAILVMGTLTFLCYSWLQSIGDPLNVVQNYKNYAGISWTALWISFISLVVFANIFLWKDGKAWALWTSLLFFVAFIVLQTFWLDKSYFAFMKTHNLAESNYFIKPFLGVTISTIAAIGVFFNQFIVLRLRDKMFASDDDVSDASEVESDEESA